MRTKIPVVVLAMALCVALDARGREASPFVPEGLPQQGRLLDSNDQPVTGKVDMIFNLYHQATGGTPVWTEEQTVSVEAGYYAIVLGDPADTGVQPITTDELAGPTWIGVTIGGNEMQPRLQLGTVPYAQRADLANRIEGGTIDGATITNSSVDATSVSVGGQTVIDANGNVNATSLSVGGNTVIDSSGSIGGKPLSDYVTNDSLTQNYTTSADLAGQGYDNLVRNGSFELGQAGAMPTYWDAVGGSGARAQVADPKFGASALEIDGNNTAQVAVRQVVIPAADIGGYVGETFTVSVWAKRKVGSTQGRLCLVESDTDETDCALLTAGQAYARVTVSHVVTSSAAYLAVLLDSGAKIGDANDYVFDGVMATSGKLAPAFAPNIAEQVPSELPAASIPDAALPADVALLDAPSDAFTGNVSAASASVTGALSAGTTTLGDTTVGGTLNAGTTTLGSATISGALSAGDTTIGGMLNAGATTLGSATISGALSAGATTLGSATVSGALSAGTTTLGNTTVGGTLSAGATTLGDTTVDGTLGAGATTLGDTTVGGMLGVDKSLSVGGAATVGGALSVTGAGTFSGDATFGGNVGIGATSPSERLVVNGNVLLPGDGQMIRFYGGSKLGKVVGADVRFVPGYAGANFEFRNFGDTATSLAVTSGGDVGIGTASPQAALDVKGDVAATGSITAAGSVVAGTARNTGYLFGNTTWATIPGMSVTVKLARSALVLFSATGDQRVNSGSVTCHIYYRHAIDGTAPSFATGGERIQVSDGNEWHHTWSLSGGDVLAAGSHTITIEAYDAYQHCVICGEAGPANFAYDGCDLNVVAVYQP